MDLSVIVPIYNEEEVIPDLFQRCYNALPSVTLNFEVILVNDGSKDKSLEMLLQLYGKDQRFKVMNLSRNFGHQAALTAGIGYSKGKYVVIMDGDLQDPPELISELYKKITTEDLDIVYGNRIERNEGFFKKLLILIFHNVFSRLSNIQAPKNVGNFSIMNRKAVDALMRLNEKNRYLPGLRYFIGFSQGFVGYEREKRGKGKAKMGFMRLTKLALDAIFSFSKLPIQACLALGVFGIGLSILIALVVLFTKIIGIAITGWTSLMVSIYFLGSIQLFFLGIIGEYVHRIYIETQNRPIYIVKEFYE